MNNKIEIDVQKILISLNLGTSLPYPLSGEYIDQQNRIGAEVPAATDSA